MGVGRIEQMKTAVAKGIDLFDCVLPMREARHGTLSPSNGEKSELRRAATCMITPCRCRLALRPQPASQKSYLCHLIRANERFGETIACMQNLG